MVMVIVMVDVMRWMVRRVYPLTVYIGKPYRDLPRAAKAAPIQTPKGPHYYIDNVPGAP